MWGKIRVGAGSTQGDGRETEQEIAGFWGALMKSACDLETGDWEP